MPLTVKVNLVFAYILVHCQLRNVPHRGSWGIEFEDYLGGYLNG